MPFQIKWFLIESDGISYTLRGDEIIVADGVTRVMRNGSIVAVLQGRGIVAEKAAIDEEES